MSLFDQNSWYKIKAKTLFPNQAMSGQQPDDGKNISAVFFHATNESAPAQQWQIFYTDDKKYMLRSQRSGPTVFLAVRYNTTSESTTGGTTAIMSEVEIAGNEVFWSANTDGSGGFALTNMANGTDWTLAVKGPGQGKDAGLIAMSPKGTEAVDNQSFSFTKLKNIDDERFSAVQRPTATSTAAPTSTSGSSSNSNTSSPTPPSSGLSTGAKAAIGASVGGVVLIVLIVGILFLLRRRRQRRTTHQAPAVGELAESTPSYDTVKYGYTTSDAGEHQPPANQTNSRQELGNGGAVVEMPDQGGLNELEGTGRRQMSPVELASDQHPRR